MVQKEPERQSGQRELRVHGSDLVAAGRGLREAADLLRHHTDTLIVSFAPGGRSPWGLGVIGLAMDQVNEMLGQACRRMHTNIDRAGVGLQEMAEVHGVVDHTLAHAFRANAIPSRHGGPSAM